MILPREPIGNSELHQWGRSVVRYIKSITLKSAPNGKVKITTDGTIIVPDVGAGGGTSTPATLEAFTFVLARKDYIVCLPRGITDPALRVNIAKPPDLRLSVLNAVIDGEYWTYSNAAYVSTANEYLRRDATLTGVGSEKQVIVPRYRAAAAAAGSVPAQTASIIYAMKVTGGTGVLSDLVLTGFPVGSTVEYLEISPRHWSTKADQST